MVQRDVDQFNPSVHCLDHVSISATDMKKSRFNRMVKQNQTKWKEGGRQYKIYFKLTFFEH